MQVIKLFLSLSFFPSFVLNVLITFYLFFKNSMGTTPLPLPHPMDHPLTSIQRVQLKCRYLKLKRYVYV